MHFMMMQKIKEEANEISQEQRKYSQKGDEENKIILKMSTSEEYKNQIMRVLIKEEVLEISEEEEEKYSKHGQNENKILLKHSSSKECKIQELSKQIDDIPEVETKSNCEMKIEIEDSCPLLKEDKSQKNDLKNVHSSDCEFTCEICNKHFTCKHSLKAHIDTHTDNRPFECEKIKEEVNVISQEQQKYSDYSDEENKIILKMSSSEKCKNQKFLKQIDNTPEVEPKCEIKIEEDDSPLFQTVLFCEDKSQEFSAEVEPKCEITIEEGDGCPKVTSHEDKMKSTSELNYKIVFNLYVRRTYLIYIFCVTTFLENPGLQNDALNVLDIVNIFLLFFTEDFVKMIVDETNIYAQQFLCSKILSPRSPARQWVPVTMNEMYVFLALFLLMGIINKPTLKSYFSTKRILSTPAFSDRLLNATVVNAMIIYNKNNQQRGIDHLAFMVNLVEGLLLRFSDEEQASRRVQSRKHSSDNTIPRLCERHFISRIPPSGKKARPQRRCVVCTKNKRKKDTVYWCRNCDVGLCLEVCFEDYHTKLNY
ncbi:hypothetical protein C0J52_03287 [Blattella germanica]|nr:hypothetical protein C0J52_03287 [Blattella germanica]